MISTELGHLSDWLLGYAAKGDGMPPERAAHLARVLLDLAERAKQLERLPVDDAALVAYAAHGDADVY